MEEMLLKLVTVSNQMVQMEDIKSSSGVSVLVIEFSFFFGESCDYLWLCLDTYQSHGQ